MNRVNVLNQELFLEQFNKFIVLDRKSYLDFIRVLTSINNKESKEKISINGMELNEKNTMILDFSSIYSYCNTVYYNKILKDEYIKLKLENYIDRDKKQLLITEEINKIINSNYKGLYEEDFIVDIDKIVKLYTNITIKGEKDFFKILKYVIEYSSIKQYIIIYSKTLLQDFNIQGYIDNINDNKVIKIELCSEKSKICKNDNITFVKELFYQISGSELYNLIKLKNVDIKDRDIENLFMSSLNYKGDDNMKKNKLIRLKKICNERLNILNLKEFET